MQEKRPNDINEENEVVIGEVEGPAVPKTGLPLRVERMSDDEWKRWTIIVGVVLGLASGGFLFFYPSSEGSFFSMGSIVALGLAIVLPGYLERSLERRAPALRIALIITLAVVIVGFLGYMFITGQAQ